MSRPHTSVSVYHTHFVLNARSVFSTGCRVFVRKSFSRRDVVHVRLYRGQHRPSSQFAFVRSHQPSRRQPSFV